MNQQGGEKIRKTYGECPLLAPNSRSVRFGKGQGHRSQEDVPES